MDHGTISWDILENKFIKEVANIVNNRQGPADVTALQSALDILESIVMQGTGKHHSIIGELELGNLIQQLQSSNQETQKKAIGLMNALFQKSDSAKRKLMAKTLQSKSLKNIILNNVLYHGSLGAEMSHQLYVLQTLLFNLLEERMLTRVDVSDSNVKRDISKLRLMAFDNEVDLNNLSTIGTKGSQKDYKKLGFLHPNNLQEDFLETPPGVLALENMIYFAENHGDNYAKVVLENSCRMDEHDCPFVYASIAVTKMLCEILKIGEPPHDEGQIHSYMFFTHDRPFEEFYCHCIQLLNKTWKEMRATYEDFPKVLGVVKEQITRALDSKPPTFDQFRTKLNQLTYTEITNIWQQERQNKEDWESQAKPIVELREKIKPEILELIKQQRLNYLIEGTMFSKYDGKGRTKGKFWYCRLSPNHKQFHYGDCDEDSIPPLEQLPSKLAVADIKDLTVGNNLYAKDKKKANNHLAFTIYLDQGQEPCGFVAPDEDAFHMWTDGINALLGRAMVSVKTEQDLEILLGMEIKLRLLDIEGITIPENPPPIPREPPNYDFAYNYC